MALRIEIYSGTGEPIYVQIETQVRRAVASGRLREGEQLPSVRALAEQLTVNPNTVARAYNEMVSEGILESQPGRGIFVARRRQIFSLEERQRRLDEAIRRFLDETAFLDIPHAQILKRLAALSTGNPPNPKKSEKP